MKDYLGQYVYAFFSPDGSFVIYSGDKTEDDVWLHASRSAEGRISLLEQGYCVGKVFVLIENEAPDA